MQIPHLGSLLVTLRVMVLDEPALFSLRKIKLIKVFFGFLPYFLIAIVFFSLHFFISPIPRASAENSIPTAEGDGFTLGQEYTNFKRDRGQRASEQSSSFAQNALLYIPNRILDLLDIFRIDVGVGPSAGGVIRVTKWGQAGMRTFAPASIRFGLRGRKSPVFVERNSEYGIGPFFVKSKERKTTPAEVGLGLDLLVAGAYAGVSLDSAADFLLGIFGVDLDRDDL